jgi:3-hydroxybutyryl-CoA dehydrogenase
MGLGYGHPMGPLCSTHPLGLHVRFAIAEFLPRSSARAPPPPLLREKVAADELGRKTGRGFYTYT